MRKPILLLAIVFLVCTSLWAGIEGRYALVIGNGDYQKTTSLANPANDATDIAKMLEDIGFSVMLETDASLLQMEGTIREFTKIAKASSAETTLFYYAGHGVQFEGINYLLPVDADIHNDYELRSKAVSMDLISSALNETDSSFNLILLDACRDNPFATSRGGARGLLAMGGGNPESMVVFSTSPGSVAQDGEGANSPFTTALKQNLNTPDQEVRQLIATVSKSVQENTKGRQIPWVNTSFTGFFYFVTAEQQLARSSAEAQRLKDELTTLESAIDGLQRAMATEKDTLVLQRLKLEQQRTQALEASKRLESQKMEELRRQAEDLLLLQYRELEAKRVQDAKMIGEQDSLSLQAAQRKAEMEQLELQRAQSTGAMSRLETIARAELTVRQIKESFDVSIEKAKHELAAMKIKLEYSYKTTNSRDPWETEAEFNARVTNYGDTLDRENGAKIRELEKRRDSEVMAIGVAQMKNELTAMRFTTGSTVVVSKFDAENKRFPMKAVSTLTELPLEASFYHTIANSDRDVLLREYQRIDNADKAKALVGEIRYALKEVSPGNWSARIVSLKLLNLLEGSKDKPGIVISLNEGAYLFGKDVFINTENIDVKLLVPVTLDRQGGTTGSDSVTATYKSALPFAEAPERGGYLFDGYYDEVGGKGTQYFTSEMTSAQKWDKTMETTLYAKWIAFSSPMTYVEGGSFQMGSTSGEWTEKPIHTVTVDSFYIGTYEFTQDLYKKVTGHNPSCWKGDRLPVEVVNWYKAVQFCNALSRYDGLEEVYTIDGSNVSCDWNKRGYRLPTEAEWEYAARGGNKSQGYTYAGSNTIGNVAWYKGNSGDKTHVVGGKTPNELGLYDMSGNVHEWCWDWGEKYSAAAEKNPKGPSSGTFQVLRGGSWFADAQWVRTATRLFIDRSLLSNDTGFRVLVPADRDFTSNMIPSTTHENPVPSEPKQQGKSVLDVEWKAPLHKLSMDLYFLDSFGGVMLDYDWMNIPTLMIEVDDHSYYFPQLGVSGGYVDQDFVVGLHMGISLLNSKLTPKKGFHYFPEFANFSLGAEYAVMESDLRVCVALEVPLFQLGSIGAKIYIGTTGEMEKINLVYSVPFMIQL